MLDCGRNTSHFYWSIRGFLSPEMAGTSHTKISQPLFSRIFADNPNSGEDWARSRRVGVDMTGSRSSTWSRSGSRRGEGRSSQGRPRLQHWCTGQTLEAVVCEETEHRGRGGGGARAEDWGRGEGGRGAGAHQVDHLAGGLGEVRGLL